ncbi:hypothetical protein [Bradyrhizobium archetypum]|uniref:Uncharacterized protein n=1 Tax=Bradyrhizobium archetypum TaxID=2721160 RepID=A0A7Y4M3K8_9BRAD|nr:hypothetical protein [Bradyrhizobium archetypum]NOJ48554.1 hypothetical protein [Bradyrhizobium archetypum]
MGNKYTASRSARLTLFLGHYKRVHHFTELTMASPFMLFPEPETVTLKRTCLAQMIISLAALTSTGVLLSKVVTVMNGMH